MPNLTFLARGHLAVAIDHYEQHERVVPKTIVHGHVADLCLVPTATIEAEDLPDWAGQTLARFGWVAGADAVAFIAEAHVKIVRGADEIPDQPLADLEDTDPTVVDGVIAQVIDWQTGETCSAFATLSVGDHGEHSWVARLSSTPHPHPSLDAARSWAPPDGWPPVPVWDRVAMLDEVWAARTLLDLDGDRSPAGSYVAALLALGT